MKNLLLCFALLFPLVFKAQFIPNYNFRTLDFTTCPADTNVAVTQPAYWTIYQTENDLWWGPMDTSICINATFDTVRYGVNTFYGIKIPITEIDTSKALFIRSDLHSIPLLDRWLMRNWLYNAGFNLNNYTEKLQFETSPDCPGDLCSGLILHIQIPDSIATGTIERQIKVSYGNPSLSYTNMCIATEYFEDGNYLSEFIIKLTLVQNQNLRGKYIRLSSGNFENYGHDPDYITTIIMPSFLKTGANAYYSNYLQEVINARHGTFLALYDPNIGYPAPSNISYIDINTELNEPEPQDISLTVASFETLNFQPFTAFRGGKVTGNDTLRHTFNLVIEGGDICFDFSVEQPFDGPGGLTYKDGNLNFQSKNTCLQFNPGATLTVDDNAYFHYGNNGNGMLLLREGSTIDIKKGATLFFDGTMMLNEKKGATQAGEVYMELKPGTKLEFSKNARINNELSQFGTIRLNVYMKGGILDDSWLDAKSRLLINKIYPAPSADFAQNISVQPNPSFGDFTLEYLASEQEEIALSLFDLQGKLILSQHFFASKGMNFFQLDISKLEAGIYYAHFKNRQRVCTKKLLKIAP